MKYRSFVKTMWVFGLFAFLGLGFGTIKLFSSCSNSSKSTQAQAIPPPVPAQTVAPTPVTVQQPAKLTTPEVRSKVEAWLSANPDRQGRMQQDDILPNEPFKATAVRFKDTDAATFSNDSRQWSQIRLDRDRDGFADEKWLLKNGHTYKREALDGNGKTIAVQYFDK